MEQWWAKPVQLSSRKPHSLEEFSQGCSWRCVLSVLEQWLSAMQLLGHSCLGTVAEWPKHRRWLLKSQVSSVIRFFGLLLDSVLRRLTVWCTYIRSRWLRSVHMAERGSGWVLRRLEPQLCRQPCGDSLKSRSGGRVVFVWPDSVSVATCWWTTLKSKGD